MRPIPVAALECNDNVAELRDGHLSRFALKRGYFPSHCKGHTRNTTLG
jgi:hypothetical protein